ncbi:MAG: D-tyrosyl-tRNA(Tyr) deacylase [Planctomycetes bacterium]|nr:D-tyrosyl-tRNA(Tyr) deacylase [Planctomycetota bacterium]
MKAVLQRVSSACVRVEGAEVGRIGSGLLVFLGVLAPDDEAAVERLLDRVLGYRVFSDAGGKMNLALAEVGGELLVVSQFTLAADGRKGRRPSFDAAAPPARARELYELFVQRARERVPRVATGAFGAHMTVEIVNDGPATFLLEA